MANADTHQWQPQQTTTTTATPASPSDFLNHSMEESLPGAASISSFVLGRETVVVTTSASLSSSDTLCVAMTTTEALESPVTAELDLSELKLGPLVAVKTFADTKKRLKMTAIDCQGTIVCLGLTADRLVPCGSFRVWKTTDYVDKQSLQEVTGSELQSTMVVMLSATTLIIAMNPLVMTVNLEQKTSYIWSELKCVELMASRTSSFGNLIFNVSDLLMGKQVEVKEMAPTAAMCLASDSSSSSFPPSNRDSSCFLFTLHSDGTARKWKVDLEESFLPLEVSSLEGSPEKLPVPSIWSDARNSVCICARLYSQVYVLTVHIQTEDPASFLEEASSPSCHLCAFWGAQEPDPITNSLELNVPAEATALVGMDFVPTEKRCTLSVLFESSVNKMGSIQVVYPPSNFNILIADPIVQDSAGTNLKMIADKERARIESLCLGSTVLEDFPDSSQSTLEQTLHELDAMYMKYLFRPIFPRGTGTVLPPVDTCIRRALAKLVQGASKYSYAGGSIELETLRVMHDWRLRENRKVLAMTTTPIQKKQRSGNMLVVPGSANLSVYDSFVQEESNHGDEFENDMEVDEDDEEALERLEQERSVEVEAHENRWRRFLLQVWEEEQLLRIPLACSWLDSTPGQIIVRAGITTLLTPDTQSEPSNTSLSVLDTLAIKLLQRIEQDKEMGSRLNIFEQQVANIVSKAQLAVSPSCLYTLLQELNQFGKWAWFCEEDAISDEEHEELEESIRSLSPRELVAWIGNVDMTNEFELPALGLLGSDMPSHVTSGKVTWSQSQVANSQLRHSACNFAILCIDSVRRLQLGRCLILTDLIEGGLAREAALRAYVHSISVLWTSAQRVPMPSTALKTKRTRFRLGPDIATSPPNKRLSYGDDASSIISQASATTTAMDALMIEISQTMDSSSEMSSSPAGAALHLSKYYFQLAFSNREKVPTGKPSLLPELGALPTPRDASIATDYPRLALRLLAPYVACTLPEDTPDIVLARKESLAECLLIESHSESSMHYLKTEMRQMACKLLVPESQDDGSFIEQDQIHAAFDILQSFGDAPPVPPTVLQTCMRSIVQGESLIEIDRLCDLETVKGLYAPIASGKVMDIDDDGQGAVKSLAHLMLRVSRLMHRVTILERHIGKGDTEDGVDNSEIILGFISRAIKEMRDTFPEEICPLMPEYRNLWSRLFHHSVLAGNWSQAYNACIRNPLSERRESNFRRLVRAMVDAGALSDLLEMCTELGLQLTNSSPAAEVGDTSECVDLYEIASDILAAAISSDVYIVRAGSSEPSRLSDYQGALYALHCSQKQWRRAAQSMDLRYLNARKALGTVTTGLGMDLHSAELRDNLIVEDLVLAAVAASNAINLVRDSSHQFLVSGEYGPYNNIPVDGFESKLISRMKRARSLIEESKGGLNEEEDRLSNFMSVTALKGRAVRCIALKTLFFDKSTSQSSVKKSLLHSLDSSNIDIDQLFKYGYYRYGMLLAKGWSTNREVLTGSHRPEGQDLFYDSLVHMMQNYLIPLSLGKEITMTGPSLQQLQSALDDIGTSDATASCIATERYGPMSSIQPAAIKAAALALIRKITLAYSTAETPLALDVASGILNFHESDVSLPAWLENLLLGIGGKQPNGLFAKRPVSDSSGYLGNPSALLSLYMKQGMFIEACNVVTGTLLGHDGSDTDSRQSNASSRLPEKGEVDFVPYTKIDLLWNFIEVVLSKPEVDKVERLKVREARDQMESALQKHFVLLKISEMGMKSARALKQ